MKTDIPIHPAAAIFPMMSEPELQALAEDIKTNGLRQPLVKTAKDELVDGRNRLAACEMAGVEPEFVTLNGEDAMAFVVSLNIKRRNLTAGQRAIAGAEAWRMAVKEGKAPESGKGQSGKGTTKLAIPNPQTHFSKLFGTTGEYLRQARDLLEEAPDLAESVRLGSTLAPEYRELESRRETARAKAKEIARRDAQRERMKSENADLAEAVDAGAMNWEQAMTEAVKREEARRRQEEDEIQSRRVLTQNLVKAVDLLQMKIETESVEDDLARLDPGELKGLWTHERVGRAAQYLAKVYELMES